MKIIQFISILFIAGLTLTSCGQGEIQNDSETHSIETESHTEELDDGHGHGEEDNLNTKPEEMDNYQTKALENGDIVAVMKTTNGVIKIKLFVDDVPMTALNFMGHAQNGYYDGIIFHRVINNFMIQGGDPDGTGMGGTSIYGEKFNDEFSNKLSNIAGSISMANSGENTNGSQFFINQVDNSNLDFDKPPFTSKHAVFGQVVEGMENVNKIAKTKVGAGDKPIKEVKIISLTIQEYNNGTYKDYTFDLEAKKKELEAKKAADLEAKNEANKTRAVAVEDKVSIHYNGTLKGGETFDSSYERGEPIEFVVGAGMMIKGFDEGVLGMKMGEKKTLTLSPAEAYGDYDETKIQTIPKTELTSFEQAGIKIEAGAELPTQQGIFKIKEVKGNDVVIDLNHTLAGKTLVFDIEMVEFKN